MASGHLTSPFPPPFHPSLPAFSSWQVTTGASDDLRKVTQIVYQMIQVYGMNDRIGNLAFPKQVSHFSSLSHVSLFSAGTPRAKSSLT
jgi:hypothetical protein